MRPPCRATVHSPHPTPAAFFGRSLCHRVVLLDGRRKGPQAGLRGARSACHVAVHRLQQRRQLARHAVRQLSAAPGQRHEGRVHQLVGVGLPRAAVVARRACRGTQPEAAAQGASQRQMPGCWMMLCSRGAQMLPAHRKQAQMVCGPMQTHRTWRNMLLVNRVQQPRQRRQRQRQQQQQTHWPLPPPPRHPPAPAAWPPARPRAARWWGPARRRSAAAGGRAAGRSRARAAALQPAPRRRAPPALLLLLGHPHSSGLDHSGSESNSGDGKVQRRGPALQ